MNQAWNRTLLARNGACLNILSNQTRVEPAVMHFDLRYARQTALVVESGLSVVTGQFSFLNRIVKCVLAMQVSR